MYNRVFIRLVSGALLLGLFSVMSLPGSTFGVERIQPVPTPLPALYPISLATTSEENEPEEYRKDEFPSWLQSLRRGEIIAIGFFPFAFLLSQTLYDVGRYAVLSAQGHEDAAVYAPLFFAPPEKPENSFEENLGIILSSAVLSIIVAVIDGVIDANKQETESDE